MGLISVQEYKTLTIADRDLNVTSSKSVTNVQADQLVNLKATYGFDIVKYANKNTLQAQQYVGVIQLGKDTLEILPKIDGDAQSIRRNLVAMLFVALDLNISEGDVASVSSQNHGLLEILIKLFCDKLFLQVHKGLVRKYETNEENLAVLRGKLVINSQIRMNAANPERLYCRYDEFQSDNPLNQILKATVRLLLKSSANLTNQRKLTELMLVFESVRDCPQQSLPWGKVTFDRMSERYRSCFKLAELFLKNTPPDVTGGKAHGFSLFFDMNELFEKYIGKMAVRVFSHEGYSVSLQDRKKHLAYDENQGRKAFALEPDIVARLALNAEWIIDTKWKSLGKTSSWYGQSDQIKDVVSPADFYQMYAYSNSYNCQDVILLYPHYKELGEAAGIRKSFKLEPWKSEINIAQSRIRVATIDLSNLKSVPNQLMKIVSNQLDKLNISTYDFNSIS